ncbi:MAG TPA: hypothetical protein VMA98_05120 [Candidatus Acidoferrales bacterium]|nr:hypothetical protein [Candidatus Acidoferrales bacterium]
MLDRYLVRVVLTSLALSATIAASPPPACPYAPRVVRKIRAALMLRVLEARRARLAVAKEAILGTITIDQLLALPDDASVLAQGTNDARLKHFHARGTSKCW